MICKCSAGAACTVCPPSATYTKCTFNQETNTKCVCGQTHNHATSTSYNKTTNKCTVCGEGHASCTGSLPERFTGDNVYHWKVCTVCGKINGKVAAADKHTHQTPGDDDWTITKAATCTEDGSKTFTCSCGKVTTATITKLGHDWNTEWTTSNTKHWHTCKHSGCTVINSEGDHDYKVEAEIDGMTYSDGKCACGKVNPDPQTPKA